MTDKQKRFYSIVFFIAGVYNILWGLLAAIYPQWLFHFSNLQPLNHPQMFQCIGMIVGVYGLLYIEASRRIMEGFAIILIGLLGKVLGPIGWVQLYLSGEWPLKSIVLILTNDLIWWVPFTLYLIRVYPEWRKTLSDNRA